MFRISNLKKHKIWQNFDDKMFEGPQEALQNLDC